MRDVQILPYTFWEIVRALNLPVEFDPQSRDTESATVTIGDRSVTLHSTPNDCVNCGSCAVCGGWPR